MAFLSTGPTLGRGIDGVLAGSRLPEFYPESIPSLKNWWRPLDLVDAGQVDGPLNSQTSRKGNMALAASLTARPSYSASYEDRGPACVFDGVDDKMVSAGTWNDFFGQTSGEQWILIRPLGSYCGLGFMGDVPGVAGLYAFSHGGDNNIVVRCPGVGNEFSATLPVDWVNSWHVIRFVINGSSRKLQFDGVTAYEGGGFANPSTSSAGYVIGECPGVLMGSFAQRDILTFADVLSAEDADALLNFLNSQYL